MADTMNFADSIRQVGTLAFGIAAALAIWGCGGGGGDSGSSSNDAAATSTQAEIVALPPGTLEVLGRPIIRFGRNGDAFVAVEASNSSGTVRQVVAGRHSTSSGWSDMAVVHPVASRGTDIGLQLAPSNSGSQFESAVISWTDGPPSYRIGVSSFSPRFGWQLPSFVSSTGIPSSKPLLTISDHGISRLVWSQMPPDSPMQIFSSTGSAGAIWTAPAVVWTGPVDFYGGPVSLVSRARNTDVSTVNASDVLLWTTREVRSDGDRKFLLAASFESDASLGPAVIVDVRQDAAPSSPPIPGREGPFYSHSVQASLGASGVMHLLVGLRVSGLGALHPFEAFGSLAHYVATLSRELVPSQLTYLIHSSADTANGSGALASSPNGKAISVAAATVGGLGCCQGINMMRTRDGGWPASGTAVLDSNGNTIEGAGIDENGNAMFLVSRGNALHLGRILATSNTTVWDQLSPEVAVKSSALAVEPTSGRLIVSYVVNNGQRDVLMARHFQ
ncbi:MAG: hypothetical protein ACKVQU_36785 [Burkholderiales bacterium]